MSMLTCRYCGRPIAVPASTCPWCKQKIMVICAACKQYSDDRASTCEHCGQPLVEDTFEEVRATLHIDPALAQIVADRERARLVASAVVARYLPGFFFDNGQRRTVLVDLFGGPPDPYRESEALLFVALAYLVQGGYALLRAVEGKEDPEWLEARAWDGQSRCLEATLARQAGEGVVERVLVRQAIDRAVAAEMEFKYEAVKPPRLRTPATAGVPRVRDQSARTVTTALVELARQTELPAHEQAEACRQVYQTVLDFARADVGRARYVAGVIREVVDWYREYEKNPEIVLLR